LATFPILLFCSGFVLNRVADASRAYNNIKMQKKQIVGESREKWGSTIKIRKCKYVEKAGPRRVVIIPTAPAIAAGAQAG
jgi:hypothetical protein